MDAKQLAKGVNYAFFDEILKRNNFEGKSALEFGRFVYECTWMKYRMKFFEEKVRADRANGVIIEKNIEMEKLLDKFKSLAKAYEEKTGERVDIPKTTVDPIETDT